MIISTERFLLFPSNLVDYTHPRILAVCIKGCHIPAKK